MGSVVTPEFPAYHWKVGEVPDTATVKVAVLPLTTTAGAGARVMEGGIRTFTVAEFEFAVPAVLEARAQ